MQQAHLTCPTRDGPATTEGREPVVEVGDGLALGPRPATTLEPREPSQRRLSSSGWTTGRVLLSLPSRLAP